MVWGEWPLWRFWAVDLRRGANNRAGTGPRRLGLLSNLRSRSLLYQLRSNATLSFDAPWSDDGDEPQRARLLVPKLTGVIGERLNPRLPLIVNPDGSTRPQYTRLYTGYVEDKQLQLQQGELLAHFEVVDASTRLQKTLANDSTNRGRTEPGLRFPAPEYPSLDDRAAIFRHLLDFANSESGRWLRCADQGAISQFLVSEWGGAKTLWSCLDELSNGLDGFEWAVDPAEGLDAYGHILGQLRYASRLGSDKPGVRFECGFGEGKDNCTGAEYHEVGSYFANRFHHVASGRTPYLMTESPAPSVTEYGIWDDFVSADVVDEQLRRKLVELNNATRGMGAQVLVAFQPTRSDMTGLPDLSAEPVEDPTTGQLFYPPHGRTPIPLIDYGLGDGVSFEWKDGDQPVTDGMFRAHSIGVNLDEQDQETADLALNY